jgi:hypothetical protein
MRFDPNLASNVPKHGAGNYGCPDVKLRRAGCAWGLIVHGARVVKE